MTFYLYITPFGVVPANAQFHRQDCFINPSFLEMAYACNPPANYRCRQSVSLLSGSLNGGPTPRLQRHSGRFCEHLVAGSKDLSEELLSPSRGASKIPPASPAPLVMRLFAGLSCGRYLSPSSSAETALSTAAGDTDRVLTRRNRRFSGSFLHFNVFAVDAVGVLRTSPPTSCSP